MISNKQTLNAKLTWDSQSETIKTLLEDIMRTRLRANSILFPLVWQVAFQSKQ